MGNHLMYMLIKWEIGKENAGPGLESDDVLVAEAHHCVSV